MDKTQIAKLLTIINGTYPNFQANQATSKIWLEILKDEDASLAYKALIAYVSEGHAFAPNPGQIKKIISKWRSANELLAEEAWMLAVEGAKTGTLPKIIKEHPAASFAVRSVTWEKIRYADIETELPFVRNQFISAFNNMAEKNTTQNQAIGAGVAELLEASNIKAIQ